MSIDVTHGLSTSNSTTYYYSVIFLYLSYPHTQWLPLVYNHNYFCMMLRHGYIAWKHLQDFCVCKIFSPVDVWIFQRLYDIIFALALELCLSAGRSNVYIIGESATTNLLTWIEMCFVYWIQLKNFTISQNLLIVLLNINEDIKRNPFQWWAAQIVRNHNGLCKF